MKKEGRVITPAPGLASCDKILHLDLARFMSKPQQTIKDCLTLAIDNHPKCHSIAFPALGTGSFLAIFHIFGACFVPTLKSSGLITHEQIVYELYTSPSHLMFFFFCVCFFVLVQQARFLSTPFILYKSFIS